MHRCKKIISAKENRRDYVLAETLAGIRGSIRSASSIALNSVFPWANRSSSDRSKSA